MLASTLIAILASVATTATTPAALEPYMIRRQSIEELETHARVCGFQTEGFQIREELRASSHDAAESYFRKLNTILSRAQSLHRSFEKKNLRLEFVLSSELPSDCELSEESLRWSDGGMEAFRFVELLDSVATEEHLSYQVDGFLLVGTNLDLRELREKNHRLEILDHEETHHRVIQIYFNPFLDDIDLSLSELEKVALRNKELN